ncbi:MAG: peptide-methionine (S)-S-oxide reductase MsrA [Verrucomicrobiota bacterium]
MKTFPRLAIYALCLFFPLAAYAAGAEQTSNTASKVNAESSSPSSTMKTETATFAGGCFWCTEGVFERIPGVKNVISGYTGGADPNPTYQKVCSPAMKVSDENHAEAIQITYDPAVISYDKLLEWFWKAHDPTTLNRQGNDVGTQYRSAIFYHDDNQKELAEASMKLVDDSGAFKDPVVTQIVPAGKFHVAEAYHQDYFANNPNDRYCNFVLAPKLRKLFGE